MDVILRYFIKTYPSLLLLPYSNSSSNNSNSNNNNSDEDNNIQPPPPPNQVIQSISTILTFQSTLLRNGTNKYIYNSVTELSTLLSSSNDTIVSLTIDVLSSLAIPTMLHRQQGPELMSMNSSMGGGLPNVTTALHRASGAATINDANEDEGGEEKKKEEKKEEDCNVMYKLMALARGWGTKGSGLGLLDCIVMDDSDIKAATMNEGAAVDVEGGSSSEEEKKQDQHQKQQSFVKCAGEISFECYIPSKVTIVVSGEGEGKSGDEGKTTKKQTMTRNAGRLVSLYVSKEEMFVATAPSPNTEDDSSEQQQAEKRRKMNSPKRIEGEIAAASSSATTTTSVMPQMKSTSQLYHECLSKISIQLQEEQHEDGGATPPAVVDPTTILSSEQLFTLLASIRLARSFHSSTSRISAIERRLRALICMIHGTANSNQENISAYFIAQPELCGELVDLLRPTVSSGNISSGVVLMDEEDGDGSEEEEKKSDGGGGGNDVGKKDNNDGGIYKNNAILALSDSPVVPYSIRTLAIEALTALVARRDATTGMVTNVARQTNVLPELGVGKGQYLGLLPTLIRYSLAALNSFLLHDSNNASNGNALVDGNVKSTALSDGKKKSAKDIGLELGLAFLKATKPPPLPQNEREERALEFIDSVLTLTSAVISVPTGTASLTDCGIIPALVSTIALDGQMARRSLQAETASPFCTSSAGNEESYSDCLLKFISAQAIQILEGAIVTHNHALSAFHELKGVDILVQRLSVEVEKVRRLAGINQTPSSAAATATGKGGGDDSSAATNAENEGVSDMVLDDSPSTTTASADDKPRTLQAARRVLLYSAVNCLTVVFHQHESGMIPTTTAATPSGGALIRKPELNNVLLEIMDNVDSYGGVLAALVATFLSDVMNSDPQVVHFVHKSGLAKSFLSLLMDKSKEEKGDDEPVISIAKPSAELIMALPNVITALSLTEAGAKAVAEANPFPAMMSIFCSPEYVMPNSRCLLVSYMNVLSSWGCKTEIGL